MFECFPAVGLLCRLSVVSIGGLLKCKVESIAHSGAQLLKSSANQILVERIPLVESSAAASTSTPSLVVVLATAPARLRLTRVVFAHVGEKQVEHTIGSMIVALQLLFFLVHHVVVHGSFFLKVLLQHVGLHNVRIFHRTIVKQRRRERSLQILLQLLDNISRIGNVVFTRCGGLLNTCQGSRDDMHIGNYVVGYKFVGMYTP